MNYIIFMKTRLGYILVLGLVVAVFVSFIGINDFDAQVASHEHEHAKEEQVTLPAKTMYGIPIDSLVVHKGKIEPNQFLANILLQHHVSYAKIEGLVSTAAPIFDVRHIAVGKKYTILCNQNNTAEYFIYEPNAVDYVVFDLTDSVHVYQAQKPVETKIQEAYGVIHSSLYQTLADASVNPVLAMEMADVYAWAIDFYRIQKGDWFKVIYEEAFVEGTSVGVKKILAANFNHYNKDHYAYRFTQDGKTDYFDADGEGLRKAFLKSPLKFGRLTSGFTMRRFHPVQKRNKPHLGTDYAAPKGTPIMATGDGRVIASTYKRYNGHFVKIKHNSTYTTQYLHMSKRAVKVGDVVNQGDVIGYVGSTGLATGPHVCYRFWKNGKQVNHLKEDFPSSDPVLPQNRVQFKKVMVDFQEQLQDVVPEKEVIS